MALVVLTQSWWHQLSTFLTTARYEVGGLDLVLNFESWMVIRGLERAYQSIIVEPPADISRAPVGEVMYAFVSLKIINRESKAVLTAWGDLMEYIRGVLLREGKSIGYFSP